MDRTDSFYMYFLKNIQHTAPLNSLLGYVLFRRNKPDVTDLLWGFSTIQPSTWISVSILCSSSPECSWKLGISYFDSLGAEIHPNLLISAGLHILILPRKRGSSAYAVKSLPPLPRPRLSSASGQGFPVKTLGR
jgi:hypothetical protein